MIIVRSFKVVYDKGNNPVLIQQKIINKYQNDHDFGFNIANPVAWRTWLAAYKTKSGKLLPHQSKYGDPIIYEVYIWGKPKNYAELFGEQFKLRNNINLFPGYDESQGFKDVSKKRDIKKYGRIR